MSKVFKFTLFPLVLFVALFSYSQISYAKLVKNIEQFNEAVANLSPGDEVVLANGIWRDVELVFIANGTPDKLIQLKA